MIPILPIFIITCDRVTSLREVIRSYRKTIADPHRIVIHDHGSQYPEMLSFLEKLERGGVLVYRYPRILNKDQLQLVSASVDRYFDTHPKSNYIVTDCDIALDYANNKDIFKFYSYILELIPDTKVIGPNLIIDDIPKHYPKRRSVIKLHRKRFWNTGTERIVHYNGNPYSYINEHIDTTFGMYKRGVKFNRHYMGIRTYKPYLARHLDWYLSVSSVPQDYRFYQKHCCRDVNHWGIN